MMFGSLSHKRAADTPRFKVRAGSEVGIGGERRSKQAAASNSGCGVPQPACKSGLPPIPFSTPAGLPPVAEASVAFLARRRLV